MREQKLKEMLQKICDRVSLAGPDSTGQEMVKLRLALIEQARELLLECQPKPKCKSCGCVVRNNSFRGYESDALCRKCEKGYWNER